MLFSIRFTELLVLLTPIKSFILHWKLGILTTFLLIVIWPWFTNWRADAIVGAKGEKYHEVVAFIESIRMTNKREYLALLKAAITGKERENQQMTERPVAPIVIAFNGEQPQRDKIVTINWVHCCGDRKSVV